MSSHADIMALTLAECGVKYAFGLPGGEIAAFIDSCRRADIRVLLTGHESSAAWIAQVMGQITGIPGVCFSTLGPGATNLVTGVANAFLDRAPLVAVVAQIPQGLSQTLTHQRLAIEKMFAPITKRTASVGTEDTGELIRNSLCLASSPRPGPVILTLPSDVAIQQCACSDSKKRDPVPAHSNPNSDSLTQIRARIAQSQRPLIVVGVGAPATAASVVRSLVDRLQAPFLVTPKVKGILPEDHPLFLGVTSGMAIDGDILETVRTADLIVGIGFDPVEVDKTWFAEVEVVAIDSVSMAEGQYHPLEATGNIVSLISELASCITEPRPWPKQLIEQRAKAIKRQPARSEAGASPHRASGRTANGVPTKWNCLLRCRIT